MLVTLLSFSCSSEVDANLAHLRAVSQRSAGGHLIICDRKMLVGQELVYAATPVTTFWVYTVDYFIHIDSVCLQTPDAGARVKMKNRSFIYIYRRFRALKRGSTLIKTALK